MSSKQYTKLEYLLLAMIPYTKPNGDLAISASRFFYELEKASNHSRKSMRRAFYRAKEQGYVDKTDGRLKLQQKGRDKVRPYIAKKLPKDVVLMVMFDIPEEFRYKRTQLRTLLRLRDFRQMSLCLYRKAIRMEQSSQGLNPDRSAEEITLVVVAIQIGEKIKLLLILYPFGDNRQRKFMRQINHGRDQGPGFRVMGNIGQKGAVDLQLMNGKTFQIAER